MAYICVVFTAGVVLVIHLPQEVLPIQLQIGGFDKLAHALAYNVSMFIY